MSYHDFERTRPQDQVYAPLLAEDPEEDGEAPHGHGRASSRRLAMDGSFESMHMRDESRRPVSMRSFLIRALALLCACSLSVGSHYASYILGPLKSRLSREMGTSNTEFSLLISAFSLNSTWTPLVGGILASRLGTTFTSILATGVIFLGQVFLLAGDLTEDVRLMTLGMFIFGLGVSPLAVVQETIIVRFFNAHGLGTAMALGLVMGKAASFVAAHTSYPLTQRFGPRAPFYVATALALLSVVVNLVYLLAARWLVHGSGAELEATDIHDEARREEGNDMSEARALHQVAEKRKVNLRDITKLGDVFWAYIGINVLCGCLWSPFTHLAANILERRYNLTEADASNQASYLLVGSIFLYPICGSIVDRIKHRSIVIKLFALSSCFTLAAYFWLALPPSLTRTPIPGVAAFGTGIGFSPLLLVVIVPQLVPHKYVSTTLGAHKSLEQAGSTIFQTLAGLALDTKRKPNPASAKTSTPLQHLLNTLLVLNACQLLSIVGLSYLERRKKRLDAALLRARPEREDEPPSPPVKAPEPELAPENPWASDNDAPARDPTSTPELQRPLLPPSTPRASEPFSALPHAEVAPPRAQIRRGEVCAALGAGLIVFAWVLFLGTAWVRLRSKAERGGGEASAGAF